MSERALKLPLADYAAARTEWRRDYADQVGEDKVRHNRSGIEIKPIYTPEDWSDTRYMEDLGFPGQSPMTRGIYPSMHRKRTWSQRQLIGFGTPEDYNTRFKAILAAGGTAGSLIPCNSVYRGYDCDEVDPLLLGTCGAVVNSIDDMETCYRDIDIGGISTALNDPLPFTLLALLLAVAKRRSVPWTEVTGTSNQSDYISHFAANHMFFRIALPGSRRVLVDHIAFCLDRVPGWNPVSVVGQHMQQGGATPAEAMALTLCTAIQYAEDCVARGLDPDVFLPRFTFFFDISVSFFEEIAKFRAGRRVWERIVRERFGAANPKARRFKFHAQTSGSDLTRQQPLNNIARVTLQAMAGIFGGLQSLHTDAYDEVLSVPTEDAARIAISTQNILCEEGHLTDVIDPLAGSFYLETLTNRMAEEIEAVIARIDAAGGMYAAVEAGIPQTMMGESALAFQAKLDAGEETTVGVNKYRIDETEERERRPLERPDMARMEAHLSRFKAFKESRSQTSVAAALDALARAAGAAPGSPGRNVFAAAVEAAIAGCTHGEICGRLRQEMGFGEPLVLA
jgi:methylmalonyl-CoA mutase N-terminal domain/subunit